MTKNPTYKTGIKTLTDVQLKNGLPSYNILLDKIETIRENAKTVSRLPIDGSFENLKYDNIFSILGGRGAGKTSILLTILDKLRSDAGNINIIMPIIMPELIDNGDSFIGWILSAVEKEIQNIENRIKERGYRKDDSAYVQMCDKYHFFERCVFNSNNTLRNTFSELKKSYYAKVYNARRGEWDLNSDMALVSSINDRGFSLIEQFTRFWNELVETYQEYYRKNGEETKAPLIFFMIDDADLKPQIINELIFSLPKYFSHPNVVVLISASHKTLNYTVKNFMYQQITNKEFDLMKLMKMEYKYNNEVYKHENTNTYKIRFSELRYGKEYDKITTLTEEILRKLFPVSNRFYLKKYELYADKCSLKFENLNEEILDISKQFAKELNAFQREVSDLHVLNLTKDISVKDQDQEKLRKKKSESFTLTDSDDMKTAVYLSFLGKYPRDIVSGYHSFHDMIKELISLVKKYYQENNSCDAKQFVSDEFLRGIRETCVNFIDSIVSSNSNLKMFSNHSSELILERRMHWQLFLNYPLVVEMLDKTEYRDINRKNPAPFIEMICLLNFIEQLIVQVISHRKEHHGYKEFQQIIDKCGIKIIKKSEDLFTMLKQYEEFSMYNVVFNFDMYDNEHQEVLMYAIDSLDLLNERDHVDIMNNKQWYDFVSKVLFYRFSNIQQIRKHKDIIFILKNIPFADKTYTDMYNDYINLAKSIFLLGKTPGYKSKSVLNIKEASTIIDEMDAKVLNLHNVSNYLTYKINNWEDIVSGLEKYSYELENYRGTAPIRSAIRNMIEMLNRNHGMISRVYLLSYFEKIQNYISDSSRNIVRPLWLSKFRIMIEDSFSIVSDKYCLEYNDLCQEIKNGSKKYIQAVSLMYFNSKFSSRMESVEKMKQYYDELSDDTYIKQQINYLQEKEWNELAEEDDGI